MTKQKIQMALAYKGLTMSDLSRLLGWSPQLLHKRVTTGKLSLEEWKKIGEALGADAEMIFSFPDGKKI